MTRKGTSKASANERHARFVQTYIARGENATQAYLDISPKVTPGTAAVEGHRLLKLPKIQKAIEKARAELRAKFALTTDRVIQELARVAYFNPQRMAGEKGKAKQLHELDEDTAAALQIETDGDGNVLKVRSPAPSAKNTAVKQAVRILRLEDKPPPPPPEAADGRVEDPRDTARRMAFLLAKGAHAEGKAQPEPASPKRKKQAAPA